MAVIKKEPLVPVGEVVWCEKCNEEMECINPDDDAIDKVYSCKNCGSSVILDKLYPKIEFYTQSQFKEIVNESVDRDTLIQKAIENEDFETLHRLGIQIMPIIASTKQKPS